MRLFTRTRTSSPHSRPPPRIATVGVIIGAVILAGCGSSTLTATGESAGPVAGAATETGTLRLGYFANVTHAAAVLGVADGSFQRALGQTKLETQVFDAGPAAVEALNAGAIDAAFIGPSPAINAYVKSSGSALRIVAGATDNGAALVVKPEITSAEQLRGKTIATPQLGGTQDVALRNYLADHGMKTQTNGGKDSDVVNQDNSQTLDLFRSGQVDGGWLPEPWASRLVIDAGATVLVDEATLWPGKRFPTTVLVVAKSYLDGHPDTVQALIGGEITAIAIITKDPAKAQGEINTAIGTLTGKKLSDAVITAAFKNIVVTDDPLTSTYPVLGRHAVRAGLLKSAPDVHGLFDLRLLNKVLAAAGKPAVSAAGLGQE